MARFTKSAFREKAAQVAAANNGKLPKLAILEAIGMNESEFGAWAHKVVANDERAIEKGTAKNVDQTTKNIVWLKNMIAAYKLPAPTTNGAGRRAISLDSLEIEFTG